MGIFFKSFWNGQDWSGFNIAKNGIETTHTSTVSRPSVPADAIDNSSIISSGTMNAKLPQWTAVVQFLRVQALVCVYVDLSSSKSLCLQSVGFLPSALCVCNFYSGNWTLKCFLSLSTISRLCRYAIAGISSDAITFSIPGKLSNISSLISLHKNEAFH